MKKRTNKKAFTIVELVIVIAVVAILAAVLIPTFTSIVRKANVSADVQLIRNLNTALKIDGKEHKTMQDALDAALDSGFDVEKIDAKASENKILWDSKNDMFCYLEKDATEPSHHPESSPKVEYNANGYVEGKVNNVDLWEIVNEIPEVDNQKYSMYYVGEEVIENKVIKVGFDAGTSDKVESISYVNNGEVQSVVIRTNSASTTLTIDDASTGSIYHYGSLGKLTVLKCGYECYYEYGNTAYTKATVGKIVAKEGGEIKVLYATAATVAAKEDGGKILNVYCVSTNELESSDNGYTNYSNSKGGNVSFKYTDNGLSTGNLLTEAIINKNGDTIVIATITNELLKKFEGINSWIDCYSDDFAGGIGTENDPYQISNSLELALLAYNVQKNNQPKEGCISFDSAYYVLTNDIDISGKGWNPIGTGEYPFHGNLDGKGYTISGLTNEGYKLDVSSWGITSGSNNTGVSYGLFGVVGYSEGVHDDTTITIKNLVLSNVKIKTDEAYSLAALIGSDVGAAKKGTNYINKSFAGNISVSGITVEGCIESTNTSGATIGGIVGKIYTKGNLTIGGDNDNEKVINNASLSTLNKSSKLGGILGYVANSTNANFISCTNNANITATSNEGTYCAAIACIAATSETLFNNCHNFGKVYSAKENAIGFVNNILVGEKNVTLTNCTNDSLKCSVSIRFNTNSYRILTPENNVIENGTYNSKGEKQE